MNFADLGKRVVSGLSAIWYGKQLEATAHYQTGFNGSYRSGGARYSGGLTGDGRGLTIDHYRMRQNARKSWHENSGTRALVDRFADTVVDTGLKLEPSPMADILGITQEDAERWSENVGQRFHLWANSKESDYTGTNNFYQNQWLYEIFQQRDNDMFIRFHYTKSGGNQNPLQTQFIDPDQVRGDAFSNTFWAQYSSTNSVDGIIRDERGREVGYKIAVQQTDGKIKFVEVPKYGGRSGRIMMIHGYRPEYAGQGRGYSLIGHALQALQGLGDFTEAHIIQAINQSSVAFTVESSSDNPATNPFAGMSRVPAGYSPPIPATATGTAQEQIEKEAEISPEYTPIPDIENRVPGSMGVFNMEGRQRLVPIQAKAPSDTFETFTNSFLAHLAASRSMPVEVLLMRFNSNYSASRGALLLFWRVCQIWRDEMASDFLNPVYEAWLGGEIAAGRIRAPGWSDPVLRAAWLNCNWIGAPMPNIDPMRTANAEKVYLEMGYTNQERGARGHNGSSAKANIAKNKKMFADTPIAPWNVKQAVAVA